MALSPIGEEAIVALVEQAKKGNHRAFEELFLLYSDAIYRYLRHMTTDDEIARDLLQDSFLEVLESLQTLRNTTCFRSWLYRIANRKALNHIRRANFIRWLSWEPDSTPIRARILAGAEMFDESILLKLALERVKPKYRQCLILQEVDGLPQKEIAEIVGIEKSSVSQYVRRGLEELRLAYQILDNLRKKFLEGEL